MKSANTWSLLMITLSTLSLGVIAQDSTTQEIKTIKESVPAKAEKRVRAHKARVHKAHAELPKGVDEKKP